MSDAMSGPGWWLASDGKWYPPELHPSARPRPPRPVARPPGTFGFAATERSPAAPVEPPPRRGPAPRSFALALYGGRVVAYVVDIVVTVVAVWALVAVAAVATRDSGLLLGLILAVAFSLWYHVWKIAVSGQTWGMRFLAIGVADKATGRHPVGLGRAFLRALVAFAFTLVPFAVFVDLLWPLWDPYKQTLHDKAASTVVMNRS